MFNRCPWSGPGLDLGLGLFSLLGDLGLGGLASLSLLGYLRFLSSLGGFALLGLGLLPITLI